MIRYQEYFIYVVDSPDDGGYYCEIVNKDGETEHTTEVYNHPNKALQFAKRWIG